MSLRTKSLGLLVPLVTLTAVAGCGGDSAIESSPDPIALATPITLADAPPLRLESPEDPSYLRIVALAAGSSDVLISLGLAENVVGVSASETRPELAATRVVTPAHSVNVEQVLAVEPDLILIDDGVANEAELKSLKSQGATVLILTPSFSESDMTTKIKSIGSSLGMSTSAQKLIDRLTGDQANQSEQSVGAQRQSETQTSDSQRKPRVAFLYLRGNNSIYLIGGPGSGADQLLKMAGGTDAGSELLGDPFTPLSAESIAKLNPDALLVMTKGLESVGGVTGLFNLPGVAQTNAGRNQKVIVVEDQLLLSFSTRTPALVEQLRTRLQLLNQAASF